MLQAVPRAYGAPKMPIDAEADLCVVVQRTDKRYEFIGKAHSGENLTEEGMADAIVRFRLVSKEDDASGLLLETVLGDALGEVGGVSSLFEELEAAWFMSMT